MLKFRVRTKQTLAARHIECPVPYRVQTEEPGGARVRSKPFQEWAWCLLKQART